MGARRPSYLGLRSFILLIIDRLDWVGHDVYSWSANRVLKDLSCRLIVGKDDHLVPLASSFCFPRPLP